MLGLSRYLRSFLLFAACLAQVTIANAQWHHHTHGVPITVAQGLQLHPRAVADGSGGLIITWLDNRASPLSAQVYAQRIDSGGFVQWTYNGVGVSSATADAASLAMVTDGAGGAMVAWNDERNGDFDIYAQRVNGAGASLWGMDDLGLCTEAGDQQTPFMIRSGTDRALLAWGDSRISVADQDIYAQSTSDSGVPQWTANGVSVSSAPSRQWLPSGMVPDGAGGAIVTWMDLRNGGNAWDLYTQRLDSQGVPQWANDGVLLTGAASSQTTAASIPDGAGGAITVWQDTRNGQQDIYIQRVNSAGVPQWTADGVPVAIAPRNKFDPTIIADGTGGAIVAWHDYRNWNFSANADIYIQRIDGSGTAQWTSNGIGLCTTPRQQYYPQLAADGSGGAFVVWADERDEPVSNYWDIRVQAVDAQGTPRWLNEEGDFNGVIMYRGSYQGQIHPQIVSNEPGRAIVVWHGFRNSPNADIFAQRVVIGELTDAPETAEPASLVVRGISPNPFSSHGSLAIDLKSGATVRVELFDLAGRRVRSTTRHEAAGTHTFVLDGRDDEGRALPNGVYFCRVHAQGETRTAKVGILR